MPKPLPKVESANALPISTYTSAFLPSLSSQAGSHFTPPKSRSETLRISLQCSAALPPSDLESCFGLISASSSADYASSSMGWKPRAKQREMNLPDMRYLLVRSTHMDDNPGGETADGNGVSQGGAVAAAEAFASFMLTYEDGYEVVYLYEVHVTPRLQGMALGRRLMDLVEEAGRRAGMAKAMMTVFTANAGARRFYERLGYEVDEFSPEPKVLRGGKVKEPDYVILSKELNTALRSGRQ